jgi:hypothetical protein
MHKESEREAESKKVKKSDAPSPLSYKAAESYDKTQAHRSSCVKISKDAKLLKFTGMVPYCKTFRARCEGQQVGAPCRNLQHRRGQDLEVDIET